MSLVVPSQMNHAKQYFKSIFYTIAIAIPKTSPLLIILRPSSLLVITITITLSTITITLSTITITVTLSLSTITIIIILCSPNITTYIKIAVSLFCLFMFHTFLSLYANFCY